MIAWRFIITDFYQLNYNKERPPFDEAQAYSIYKRTLERYTTLVMAKAFTIRAIIHARERSRATHPQRLLNRTNHKLLAPSSASTDRATRTCSTDTTL
eukprot:scaffold35434_cov157-Isochrysis_galbana.AAC.2